MAATVKNEVKTEVKKDPAEDAAKTTTQEINMVVSDSEDDDEFLADDISSFDEGVAPPEKDRPDLVILNKKIQEIDEAKKWRIANPNDTNCVIKRPELNPLHPNVYFDKYMGLKRLKLIEQKLKFTRGVLRRFSGKDISTLKHGNRVKLQRAEKTLAALVALHTGKEYDPPKHDGEVPYYTIEKMKTLNFRAKNRIIVAAKKFVPRIEAKQESEKTAWEKASYPFYKEVTKAYPEIIKASPEEVQFYNKTKSAKKAERKLRHREDQLDKALNFIDYLLKYKDQAFTPMTKAKLERSFEIIQRQFKFQPAPKVEPSKAQPVISKDDPKKQVASQQKKADQKGNVNQRTQQRNQGNNQSDNLNRKRSVVSSSSNPRSAKMPRNDNRNNSGGNFQKRSGGSIGNRNIGQGTIGRVADIWSSVGAALNQLTNQTGNYNNQSNFGNQDNFRRGSDMGNRDNLNNKLSDILFNRSNDAGFNNDGGRRFNDNSNFSGGRNFNDSMRSDDFNRGGFNYNQGGGGSNDNFRGNIDNFGTGGSNFGNSGNFGGGSGGGGYGSGSGGNFYGNSGGGNYNDSGFNSGGYGGLDLNRANRSMDDLFTRNRSRLA